MTVNSAEFLTVCAPGSGYACGSGSAELTGTGFDDNGATPWLSTTAPVQPGEAFTLTFFVWDTGDAAINTTVLLDDFRWSASAVAGPTTQVAPEPDPVMISVAAAAALTALGVPRARRRTAVREEAFHPQGESIRWVARCSSSASA